MKNKRVYNYFLKVIKGKLPRKVKIKTNLNSIHKLKHYANNSIRGVIFLRFKKLHMVDKFDINFLEHYTREWESVFKMVFILKTTL